MCCNEDKLCKCKAEDYFNHAVETLSKYNDRDILRMIADKLITDVTEKYGYSMEMYILRHKIYNEFYNRVYELDDPWKKAGMEK